MIEPQGAHWRCNGALLIDASQVTYRFALPWRACATPCSSGSNNNDKGSRSLGSYAQLSKISNYNHTRSTRKNSSDNNNSIDNSSNSGGESSKNSMRLAVDVVIPAHRKVRKERKCKMDT